MKIRLAFLLLVILAPWAWGCGEPGTGRFQVSDVQKHDECIGRMFPFEPVFFAARERVDSMGLFFQSRGGNFQSVDVIHFEVFGSNGIEPGTQLTLDPLAARESEAVGSLELGESCPDLADSLAITGTLTLDSFSRDVDGLISGSVDGEVVSLLDDDIVAGSLTGQFDFTVQLGQPYEEFRK
jgi:hypothetical protein